MRPLFDWGTRSLLLTLAGWSAFHPCYAPCSWAHRWSVALPQGVWSMCSPICCSLSNENQPELALLRNCVAGPHHNLPHPHPPHHRRCWICPARLHPGARHSNQNQHHPRLHRNQTGNIDWCMTTCYLRSHPVCASRCLMLYQSRMHYGVAFGTLSTARICNPLSARVYSHRATWLHGCHFRSAAQWARHSIGRCASTSCCRQWCTRGSCCAGMFGRRVWWWCLGWLMPHLARMTRWWPLRHSRLSARRCSPARPVDCFLQKSH